jgi:hypothetical protein
MDRWVDGRIKSNMHILYKVQLHLCLITTPWNRTWRPAVRIATRFVVFGIRWRGVVTITTRSLYLGVLIASIHRVKRFVGLLIRFGFDGKETNPCLCNNHMTLIQWDFRFSQREIQKWLFPVVLRHSTHRPDDGGSRHIWSVGQFLRHHSPPAKINNLMEWWPLWCGALGPD